MSYDSFAGEFFVTTSGYGQLLLSVLQFKYCNGKFLLSLLLLLVL